MRILISKTGIGSGGKLVQAANLATLPTVTAAGDFARVSYTNNGAHERAHTWYPVRGLAEVNCDFKPETVYTP